MMFFHLKARAARGSHERRLPRLPGDPEAYMLSVVCHIGPKYRRSEALFLYAVIKRWVSRQWFIEGWLASRCLRKHARGVGNR